jgi:hypothetical protein
VDCRRNRACRKAWPESEGNVAGDADKRSHGGVDSLPSQAGADRRPNRFAAEHLEWRKARRLERRHRSVLLLFECRPFTGTRDLRQPDQHFVVRRCAVALYGFLTWNRRLDGLFDHRLGKLHPQDRPAREVDAERQTATHLHDADTCQHHNRRQHQRVPPPAVEIHSRRAKA